MKTNLYLLVDTSALAHRALWSVGDLTHPDDPEQYTGVLYQIWKTASAVASYFRTNNLVFCFDSKESKRRDMYPSYKSQRLAERAKEAPQQAAKRQGMYDQMKVLPKLLHEMGAKNIYGQTGYEADDLIASAIKWNPDKDFIIVGRDKDLYQLLAANVRMYDVQNEVFYTEKDFRAEYGIDPAQWASVKAWAGCTSDSVDGLPGVGDKTAIKWITGKLPQENKKYATFVENISVYNKNIPIVRLPLEGTNPITLVEQERMIDWSILARFIGSTASISDGVDFD
jgi:5'-3' exonuclease